MNGDISSAHRIREKIDDSGIPGDAIKKKDDSCSSKSFGTEDGAITFDGSEIENLREKMQEMRTQLNNVVSEIIQRLRPTTVHNGYSKETSNSSVQKRRNGKLMDKEFISRNSYLTDLFEINHFRTIYNIFIVMLIILFFNTAVHDLLETGTMHIGIKTIILGFGKFNVAIQIWALMTISTFITYFGFSVWARKRIECAPKSFFLKVLDYGFLLAFLTQQVAFIVLPTKHMLDEKLSPACNLMLLMEQVRMLMKSYAFVRSTAPRILSAKLKQEDNVGSNCPGFSKFLYFLFAPTLIYRDEYPRTKNIRWNIVFTNFAEVVMIIFYVAFIFERFLIPPFEKLGSQIFAPQSVLLTVFSIILPGQIMFLFGFYCILHSWQNCMAELLRFADRLFYKDWWNCTSYDVYYRIWNIIVHDWLYTYIYKDVYEKLHNKLLATLTVFVVSASFHEYILGFSFRFFYPVMLVMFGVFGLLLVFLTKHSKINGNIFIWLTLFMGNGMLFTFYSMEYYARAHCPPYSDQILDFVLPRSWICHRFMSNLSSNMTS